MYGFSKAQDLILKMAQKRSLDDIRALITDHPDFPKPGVLFRDIFPVLRDANAFQSLIDIMFERLKQNCSGKRIDVVVGLDARGFLFGPLLALKFGAAFVPVRKAGKLPGAVTRRTYEKEYGSDSFELQVDSVQSGQNVVVVDDLIATGGTMSATCSLIEAIGANVVQCIVVIELAELGGRKKIEAPLDSLFVY